MCIRYISTIFPNIILFLRAAADDDDHNKMLSFIERWQLNLYDNLAESDLWDSLRLKLNKTTYTWCITEEWSSNIPWRVNYR